MGKNPFEDHIESNDADLSSQLEELHRMVLDTQGEIAQVRAEIGDHPERATEIELLQKTLAALNYEEQLIQEEIEKRKK